MARRKVAANVRVRGAGDIVPIIIELTNWRIREQLKLMFWLHLAVAVTVLALVGAAWLFCPHQFWIVVDHFRCGGYCS